ncbi:hypothetical protein M2352_003805 [Azospirillum fermentarium]|uniref:hypothetical protein n=1 Tax=Azospirillum fermentarium TaxID=1233114 RepID=UPI0022278880|nr:hypothetical protein [Azospirillum fermentarium]MCW2248171.1 hypothetical protein [Azospirillum fermentarium]
MQRRVFLFLLMSALALAVGMAVPGDARAADTVLTVSGPGGTSAAFDMAALDGLPQTAVTTTTPWYDGPRTFSGPLLRTVLQQAGVTGTTLKISALNDYSVEIPAEDLDLYGVVLASRIDGKPFSVRDKGPLFVIYPFDSRTDLKQEKFYSRAVWQVAKIAVR